MALFSSVVKRENFPAILTRLASADKSAVQECVELYGKMIWALAKQYTDSPADVEPIVRRIFMDIWQNAASCDLSVSEEVVWIALIARRRLSGCMLKEDFMPLTETTINTEINYQPSPELQQGNFGNGFSKIQNIPQQIAVIH